MVAPVRHLEAMIRPLLKIPHLTSIRIGSKSIAYWPWRFLSDPDTPQLLQLLEDIQKASKCLYIMVCFASGLC